MLNSSKKPVLVVIYNHHYPENITKVESIYKNRFSHIYHLVPFCSQDTITTLGELGKRVIPVYEESQFFQGFMSQGLNSYYREDASHYIFVADDMLLNPAVDENNYHRFFKLKTTSCFIPRVRKMFHPYDTLVGRGWAHDRNAYKFRNNIHIQGLGGSQGIPSYDEAITKFKEFNLDISNIAPPVRERVWHKIFYAVVTPIYSIYSGRKIWHRLIPPKFKMNYSYPLVKSYSDICIVSQDKISKFCNYCGIFAINNLFVETAIPTSLVLLQDKLEDLTIMENLEYKNYDHYWNGPFPLTKKVEDFQTIQNLLDAFPEEYLYIHPVKLSELKIG